MSVSVEISGKYIKDNRYDVLSRGIQILFEQYSRMIGDNYPNDFLENIRKSLIGVGAKEIDNRLDLSLIPIHKNMKIIVQKNGCVEIQLEK